MSSYGSWSVKGIDDRARAAAKEAAREKGVTLGDYINDLLLDSHSEAGPRDMGERFDPFAARNPEPDPTPIDSLARRIEAVEARSTLAITGIDQSVLGLLARLDNSENTSAAIAADVERMVDELRETHEALHAKVEQLDQDDTARQNLEAMKALEQALGKLAAHVHEENSLQQEEALAIKGRVEAGFGDLGERVEDMEVRVETTLSETAKRVEKAVEQAELRAEGTSRHLSERFTAVESTVATKLAKVDEIDVRMNGVEDDVSGAIQSMEGTLLRVQERLNRAESTTDAALTGLEQTFENLDKRLEVVASHSSPERAEALRRQFQEQFEGMAASLRASVEQARTQLANEIERAAAGANPELMGRLETTVDHLKERLDKGEAHSNAALEEISAQVTELSSNVDDRLTAMEDRDDHVAERLGEQMTELADRVDQRVSDSEERSAEAISQVGEQVAGAVGRLQAKQDAQFQEFGARLDAANKRQDARLSKALSNVSERLTEMQHKTASVVSPVQKAIASLASRLEDVEGFSAPPGVNTRAKTLPPMPVMRPEQPKPIDLPPEPAPAPRRELKIEEAEAPSDVDFVAGLPAGDPAAATAEQDEVFETGFENWSNGAKPSAEADDNYTASAGSGIETASDDPLAALSDWDDARHETRENDIFADEPAVQAAQDETIDDPFGATVFVTDAPQTAEAPVETKAEPAEPQAETNPDANPEAGDAQTRDYLSRAREAAIAAAETETDRPVRRARRIPPAPKPDPQAVKKKSSSKLPILMAASVLAISAAGAGAYISLRGKQPTADPNFAQPSSPDTQDTASATTEASLQGVSYDAGADIDSDLFEEEQGSAAPRAEAPVTAPAVLAGAAPAASEPETTRLAAVQPAPAPVAALPLVPEPIALNKAALLGDPIAELTFGEERLAKEDYIKGAEFIGYAAKQGQPTAQYRYAKLFEKGLGLPRDLTQARAWTERAAQGGNVKAMHDLAVFYADGDSGEQSYAASAKWFASAADHGLVDSQYNLAVLYENGLGVSPSLSDALYWYEIAAANGDPAASQKVTELRAKLTLQAAQTVQQRAANWTATRTQPAANGIFPAQAWDLGNRRQVKAVQTVLNGLGYEAGEADGLPGPATKNAILAFQSKQGLPATGEIDQAFIQRLNTVSQAPA
ncbi:MAG: peptidoglycan-binding protein [Pseudomonadota bacterium]